MKQYTRFSAQASRNVSITMGHKSQITTDADVSCRQSQRPAIVVRCSAGSRATQVGKQPPTLDPASAPDGSPVNAGIASVCGAVSVVATGLAASGGLIQTASGTWGGFGKPLTNRSGCAA